MIRWGILGLGKIAHKFAEDLALVPGAVLVAAASTSEERAQSFSRKFGIPHFFSSYQALAECPEVDVVYVATPHVFHFEHTLLCLEQGKHVLCEKPFAMNAQQASFMVEIARKKGLFLMEAMWTRYIPAFEEALLLLEAGAIGEVLAVKADFGFRALHHSPESRIWNPALGGGALLDIGIYPLYLATLLFGEPDKMVADASFSATGVDDNLVLLCHYPSEKIANLHASLTTTTSTEAYIYGTEGSILLPSRFHHPSRVILRRNGEEIREFHFPYAGHGYHFEAKEVARCLESGLLESERHPQEMTLRLSSIMDAVFEAMKE